MQSAHAALAVTVNFMIWASRVKPAISNLATALALPF